MQTDSEKKDHGDPLDRLYVAKPLIGDDVDRECFESISEMVKAERWNEAVAICQVHVGRDGSRVEWMHHLAWIYVRQWNYEQALPVLLEVLSRQPGYQEAHALLGLVYIQLKEFEKATRHLIVAIALNPNDPIAWGRLGICYDDQTGCEDVAQVVWARSRRLSDDDNVRSGQR